MSSSLSDIEEQTSSSNACFHFIPSKNDHEQLQCNANPESSFYCIKNAQQSSFIPSTSSILRAGSSLQHRLLIKGGRVINDDGNMLADVFIEEGIIKQIGLNLIVPAGTKTIDATGKYVMPGGIDTQTHLELQFMGTRTVDDFYTGTKAAIAGGTTTIRMYKRRKSKT
ncbi:unnamed protein product [Rotaria sp. Silwood2]|nr:unnamed protein product [Rotaria sp. Silwood2]CAF2499465.1 unnamed protein product [Rotaria sp. Silwood2]CAF2897145.1 unnamed protein product [Rotaria sp. Silwood2]CAF3897058.1 unnamed protein product [Rotaria sp. Silwood2]CAF3918240.1 unnamed protein product [Rotaria sp. Silwood2]